MGCCLAAIILGLGPRAALIVLRLATTYPDMAFEGWFWPLLGFFFMPWTTLTYMGAMVNAGGIEGYWIALFILAIIFDLGAHGATDAHRRRRQHFDRR